MATGAPSVAAPRALRAAAPALAILGRAGYAAKGVVYIVIGALAAGVALGAGGATTDSAGALSVIGGGPLGQATLIGIGLGLLGYTAWALVSAVTDAEGKGDEPTSWVLRASQAIRGLGYGALGIQALRLLGHDRAQGSDTARQWTARFLDMPLGRAIVVVVGLCVLGYAAYQVYDACTDGVREHLDLDEAGPAAAKWIVRFGRFGIGARAVVLALIGVFLVRAGVQGDAGEAGGVDDSLHALATADYRWLILGTVAFGLVAFGAYQLATARFRHMRAVGSGIARLTSQADVAG
jgi:hypothetical protein